MERKDKPLRNTDSVKNGRMTVLVVSCDKYADLWNPMSDFLLKFWPDCPYEIALATESGDASPETVYKRTIHCGRVEWSGCVLNALKEIETPYVLFALDDLWPGDRVDTGAIEDLLDLMEREQIGDIHLRAEGSDQKEYGTDTNFYEYAFGAPYRISASTSIWETKFLKTVLRAEETAWEFERIGSYRPEGKLRVVLSCKHSPFPVIDLASGAVERGKWEPEALAFAARHGVVIETARRPVKSKTDRIKKNIKSFVYNLNPKLVLAVQNDVYRRKRKRAGRSAGPRGMKP